MSVPQHSTLLKSSLHRAFGLRAALPLLTTQTCRLTISPVRTLPSIFQAFSSPPQTVCGAFDPLCPAMFGGQAKLILCSRSKYFIMILVLPCSQAGLQTGSLPRALRCRLKDHPRAYPVKLPN